ncbi:von Willebrand factor type A [Mycolicibacterium rhodesiae JS60]|nr:von Willebrand factor type A [Mycolicibacterium rhodesiae JS60]
MHDAYALLASALARRHLRVVYRPDQVASTDGETLWLAESEPPLVPLVAQAGFVAAGSLHPRMMARLVGRHSACARYAVLEASRLPLLLGTVLPPAAEDALQNLGVAPIPASAGESLTRALGQEAVAPAPDIVGVISPSAVLRARATGAGEGVSSDVRLDRLRDVTNDLAEADDQESASVRDRLTKMFSKSPLSRLMRDLLGSEMSSRSGHSDGGEFAAGATAQVREMSGQGRVTTHSPQLGAAEGDVSAGTEHDEWDEGRQRYRPRHCTVHHLDPAPAATSQVPAVADDPALRRAIARIGLALERHSRLTDGDALDLRALVDFSVDRAAGVQQDPRIYETWRPTAHDLGVVVVLDASGSTRDARSAGGVIWDEQRNLAACLADALEQSGDRVALYAFRSHGRRDVRFLHVKHFDDRFDHAARRRLAALEPAGYTRLGTAVRHGALLAREESGTSRQLLVVVSDGLPYEDDYQGLYAEADVRHALNETVVSGVGCVCLSVGSTQSTESLDRIWGGFNHLYMDHPSTLAARCEPLFRAALRSALDASHGQCRTIA